MRNWRVFLLGLVVPVLMVFLVGGIHAQSGNQEGQTFQAEYPFERGDIITRGLETDMTIGEVLISFRRLDQFEILGHNGIMVGVKDLHKIKNGKVVNRTISQKNQLLVHLLAEPCSPFDSTFSALCFEIQRTNIKDFKKTSPLYPDVISRPGESIKLDTDPKSYQPPEVWNYEEYQRERVVSKALDMDGITGAYSLWGFCWKCPEENEFRSDGWTEYILESSGVSSENGVNLIPDQWENQALYHLQTDNLKQSATAAGQYIRMQKLESVPPKHNFKDQANNRFLDNLNKLPQANDLMGNKFRPPYKFVSQDYRHKEEKILNQGSGIRAIKVFHRSSTDEKWSKLDQLSMERNWKNPLVLKEGEDQDQAWLDGATRQTDSLEDGHYRVIVWDGAGNARQRDYVFAELGTLTIKVIAQNEEGNKVAAQGRHGVQVKAELKDGNEAFDEWKVQVNNPYQDEGEGKTRSTEGEPDFRGRAQLWQIPEGNYEVTATHEGTVGDGHSYGRAEKIIQFDPTNQPEEPVEMNMN